jgi:hypothetical protein
MAVGGSDQGFVEKRISVTCSQRTKRTRRFENGVKLGGGTNYSSFKNSIIASFTS